MAIAPAVIREFEAIVDRVAARSIDPYSAADELLARALGSGARRDS